MEILCTGRQQEHKVKEYHHSMDIVITYWSRGQISIDLGIVFY